MGTYIRLVDYKNTEEKEKAFIERKNASNVSLSKFNNSPKHAFLYWLKNDEVFSFTPIGLNYESGGRNKTHNNDKYVRSWWEVNDLERWQKYENGGDFRKWYGNCTDVVDWSEAAKKEYQSHGGLYNQKFARKIGISWNLISSQRNCFRIKNEHTHYSSGSPTIFGMTSPFITLGFLNSKIAQYLLKMLNPTMNTTVTDVLVLPMDCGASEEKINSISKELVKIAEEEWNEFEISPDFKRHPLL